MDDTTTGGLTQVWITVTDAEGTTRLESRWTAAAEAATHAA